jgi:hypothetical protein
VTATKPGAYRRARAMIVHARRPSLHAALVGRGAEPKVGSQCPRAAAREEYAAYCAAGLSDKLAYAGG